MSILATAAFPALCGTAVLTAAVAAVLAGAFSATLRPAPRPVTVRVRRRPR